MVNMRTATLAAGVTLSFAGLSFGAMPALAAAAPAGPTLTITVEDAPTDAIRVNESTTEIFDLVYDEREQQWVLPEGQQSVQVGGETFSQIGAEWDPDPFIAGAVAVTDTGAPSLFTVTFAGFILPISAPLNYSLTGTVGVTDGSTSQNGAAAINLASVSNPLLLGLIFGSLNGVDVAVTGTTVVAPGGGSAGGPVGAAGVIGAGGPFVAIDITFRWLGTGGGDLYAYTGRFDVTQAPVPVPAAIPLAISGLAVLGWLGRRRAA